MTRSLCISSPTILLLAAAAAAQCPGEGSRWRAGGWSDGPPLRCPGRDPLALSWRVWTPPHREPVPRAGHRLSTVRQRPRLHVRYVCTDSFLVPVAIRRERVYGYVFDVVTVPCR